MSRQIIYGDDERGRYREVIDDETGEVVEERRYERRLFAKPSNYLLEVDPELQREKRRQPWFFRIYRTNWMDLILRKRLTTNEIGVLVTLMTFLDWESNYLVDPKTKELLSTARLAEILRTDRAQLDKTLRALNDKGLVAITNNGKGRSKSYQLNSHVLYYGGKMRDVNEHKVFDDCAYEPILRKKYRQRADK